MIQYSMKSNLILQTQRQVKRIELIISITYVKQ